MLQSDFKDLKSIAVEAKAIQSELEHLQEATIALFIDRGDQKDLGDMGLDEMIGYACGDEIEEGQTFENPFNKYSYLEVVEFNEDTERALLEVKYVTSATI